MASCCCNSLIRASAAILSCFSDSKSARNCCACSIRNCTWSSWGLEVVPRRNSSTWDASDFTCCVNAELVASCWLLLRRRRRFSSSSWSPTTHTLMTLPINVKYCVFPCALVWSLLTAIFPAWPFYQKHYQNSTVITSHTLKHSSVFVWNNNNDDNVLRTDSLMCFTLKLTYPSHNYSISVKLFKSRV